MDYDSNKNLSYAPWIYSEPDKDSSNITGKITRPVSVTVPSEALQKAAELKNKSASNRTANTVRAVTVLQKNSVLHSPTEHIDWVSCIMAIEHF